MLPDFPEIKVKVLDAINRSMRMQIKQDPLFSQINEEFHFEGNRMLSRTDGEMVDSSEYKEFKNDFTVKTEDIISKGPAAFIEGLQGTAEEMKKQKAKLLFEKINEGVKKTGNTFSADGRPLNKEDFLKAFVKIQIDFEEDGSPILPTIVMHPQAMAKMKKELETWESDTGFNRRYEEIIAKKKKEWDDRESNRKLVD